MSFIIEFQNIIIDKLNILKSKITSSPPGNNIHNNIDREMLLSISNGIEWMLRMICAAVKAE